MGAHGQDVLEVHRLAMRAFTKRELRAADFLYSRRCPEVIKPIVKRLSLNQCEILDTWTAKWAASFCELEMKTKRKGR
jgi:hypothetical protein